MEIRFSSEDVKKLILAEAQKHWPDCNAVFGPDTYIPSAIAWCNPEMQKRENAIPGFEAIIFPTVR